MESEYKALSKLEDHQETFVHLIDGSQVDVDGKKFNRYGKYGQYPLRETYVDMGGDFKENYIHANYVASPVSGAPEEFINAQSPTSDGAANYWKMILLKKVALILMLCNMNEVDQHDVPKCEAYFPLTIN